MPKVVMPIREQKLNTLLENFEKKCDTSNSVSHGYHNITKESLDCLRTEIIHLINDEYLL